VEEEAEPAGRQTFSKEIGHSFLGCFRFLSPDN